jgi:hypothetical protein
MITPVAIMANATTATAAFAGLLVKRSPNSQTLKMMLANGSSSQRDVAQGGGDIVRGHRLNQHRGNRTVSPSLASSAMRPANSKNCVAWTMV